MRNILLTLIISLFPLTASAHEAIFRAEKWRMVEITLTSAHIHTDPFNTVTVTAIFTHGNKQLSRPAFWDGGNRWKIRFAPPTIGDWSYHTTCSDPQDAGLQNQQGVIHTAAYKGNLPIFIHGFLKSSPDHRYFTYADGTPFFYLGDTHWEAMHERFNTSNAPGCVSQFKCEADKRVRQGFTVYQSEWMAGGLPNPDEPVYDWDNGITDADMPGFQNADRKFEYLADHGLVIANAMNWRGLIPKYSDDYLQKLGRYWAARYGAFPVLWTMGQETDGLYPDEATAMLNTWKKSYFKAYGERLFFIVPRAWTNHYLPLKITPQARITRVMMGRIELITPEQKAIAVALAKIKRGDPRLEHNIPAELLLLLYYAQLGRFRAAIITHEREQLMREAPVR